MQIGKSAVDGKFMSVKDAKANPRESMVITIKPKTSTKPTKKK